MASIFKMCGKYLIKNKYSVICYGVLCLTSSMFSIYPDYYRAGQTWQEQAGDFKAATFFRRKRGSGNGIGTSYHVV